MVVLYLFSILNSKKLVSIIILYIFQRIYSMTHVEKPAAPSSPLATSTDHPLAAICLDNDDVDVDDQ